MAITVIIAGLDRSPRRGTLAIVETLAGRSTCAFQLDDPLGEDEEPRVGQEIVVTDGGARLFAGSIETVDVTVYPGITARTWALTCIDHHRILDRRLAGQKTYNATRSDLIIGDICINSLQGEGIDFTFVQQGPIIEEFKTDFETAAEAIDRAAKLAKQFWTVDYHKYLRVFTPEAYSCPFEISSAGLNYENLTVRSSREMYANRVIARIGEFLREPQTAVFDATGRHGTGEDDLPTLIPDGSRKSFWVTYPIHAAPTVRVNGADKTVGVAGVDSFMDWYWSAGSNTLDQDDAATPLAPGSTLEVTYVGIVSNVVDAQNGDEIALRGGLEGNSGIYEVLKDASTPQNSAQAQQFAQAALDQLDELSAVAVIATNSMIEPLVSTVRVGQRIHIDVDGYQVGGRTVAGITYGTPCVIDAPSHGRQNGERVRIVGVAGVNGTWTVANSTRDTFELAGSSASGAYYGGGWLYPCTYVIRQIRIGDMRAADAIEYQIEAVLGPIVGDAVTFFQQLAGASGIVPSGGLPPPSIPEEAQQPEQPDATGWSVTLGPSQAAAYTSEPHQRIDIEIERQLTDRATYWEIWSLAEGGSPQLEATTHSAYPLVTTVEVWKPQGSAAQNIWFVLRAASASYSGVLPPLDAPWLGATIPAISAAPTPASWSVTLEYSDGPGGPGVINGFVRGRYAFAVTSLQASSSNRWLKTQVRPHSGGVWDDLSVYQTDPITLLQAGGDYAWNQGPFSETSWEKPESPMQWDVRLGVEDHRGVVSWHETIMLVTISSGGGFRVTALEGKLGRGLSSDGTKLNSTVGGALAVLNPDFEDVEAGLPKDWTLHGSGCSLDDGVKDAGARSLKLVKVAQDTWPGQFIRAYAGASYLMRWRIRVDNNSVVGGISYHDGSFNEIGYAPPVTINPTAGAFVTIECNANDLPAATKYIQLVPARIYSTDSGNPIAWVDSVQLFEVVGNRMIYPGVLSDPGAQGWGTGAKPMLMGSILPTLTPDNLSVYPIGTHFYYTGTLEPGRTDRLRRRNEYNQWVGISGSDITAGTIAAQVAYLGKIAAGQVNAGDFVGCTLTISEAYTKVVVNVFHDTAYGQYAGLKVESEVVGTAPQRTIVTAGGSAGLSKQNLRAWEIATDSYEYGGGGSAAFYRIYGGMSYQTIAIYGSSGVVKLYSLYDQDNNRVVWYRQAAVDDPSGGSVVDVECRAAVSALLNRCRTHGLIAT